MKWAEMSERDRDALVAEKVMGTPLTCIGKIEVEASEDSSYYECASCHAAFSFAQWLGLRDDDPHTRNVEHYTTRMDAAWLVVEKFPRMEMGRYAATPSKREITEVWMLTDIDVWENGRLQPPKRHYGVANTAPEAICLAALDAAGVEIK